MVAEAFLALPSYIGRTFCVVSVLFRGLLAVFDIVGHGRNISVQYGTDSRVMACRLLARHVDSKLKFVEL